jgi:hypothetical protein
MPHKDRETRLLYAKKYREDHREKSIAYGKAYHAANRERQCEKTRIWKLQNPDKVKDGSRKQYAQNKEKIIAYSKAYQRANYEQVLIKNKIWRLANPEKVQVITKRRDAKRRGTAKGKLNQFMSRGLWFSLREKKGGASWTKFVDFTVDQLKIHIEKRFKDGMTWDNAGEWHIDHVVPIAAFNFEKAQDIDFKRCWNLKNLQPLWALDNTRKGARLSKPFQPALCLQA